MGKSGRSLKVGGSDFSTRTALKQLISKRKSMDRVQSQVEGSDYRNDQSRENPKAELSRQGMEGERQETKTLSQFPTLSLSPAEIS